MGVGSSADGDLAGLSDHGAKSPGSVVAETPGEVQNHPTLDFERVSSLGVVFERLPVEVKADAVEFDADLELGVREVELGEERPVGAMHPMLEFWSGKTRRLQEFGDLPPPLRQWDGGRARPLVEHRSQLSAAITASTGVAPQDVRQVGVREPIGTNEIVDGGIELASSDHGRNVDNGPGEAGGGWGCR